MEENTAEIKASRMQKIAQYIKRSVPEIIGLAIGSAAGFLYYKIIGCPTGTCPIVSNPW